MRSGPILERHLVRLIAAQAMGSGIVAMQAPGFLHEKDKRSHFVSRIMVCWYFTQSLYIII